MVTYEQAMRQFVEENNDLLVPEDEEICRICHSGEAADSRLVSPCRCSGSLDFVHHACLSQWVQMKGSMQCEVCRFVYTGRSETQKVSKTEFARLFLAQLSKSVQAVKANMGNFTWFAICCAFLVLTAGIVLCIILIYESIQIPFSSKYMNISTVVVWNSLFFLGLVTALLLLVFGIKIIYATTQIGKRTLSTAFGVVMACVYMAVAIKLAWDFAAVTYDMSRSSANMSFDQTSNIHVPVNGTSELANVMNYTAVFANSTGDPTLSVHAASDDITFLGDYFLLFLLLAPLAVPLYGILKYTWRKVKEDLICVTFEDFLEPSIEGSDVQEDSGRTEGTEDQGTEAVTAVQSQSSCVTVELEVGTDVCIDMVEEENLSDDTDERE